MGDEPNRREAKLRQRGFPAPTTSLAVEFQIRTSDRLSTETTGWRIRRTLAEIEYMLYERAEVLSAVESSITEKLVVMVEICEDIIKVEETHMWESVAKVVDVLSKEEFVEQYEDVHLAFLDMERRQDRIIWTLVALVASLSGKKLARQMMITEFFKPL